jgi:MoaA/NifB/PqqE/SkfB family radical SAM enzyme
MSFSEPVNINAMQSNRPQNVFYVHWNIGRRCNYDCSYCPDSLHDFKSPHRSLDNLVGIAEKMKKNIPQSKNIRIWFTGGEPTVNPNFLDFCKWLSQDGRFIVGLNTNGSRTQDYLLDLMTYINIIQFSSHFEYVEETQFMPKLKAVNDYVANKQYKSISLNLMMEPEYWNRAVDMVKYCIRHNIPYHMKRIRPKSVVHEGKKNYIPVYTEDQIRFLTDNEYRNAVLEEYDE